MYIYNFTKRVNKIQPKFRIWIPESFPLTIRIQLLNIRFVPDPIYFYFCMHTHCGVEIQENWERIYNDSNCYLRTSYNLQPRNFQRDDFSKKDKKENSRKTE